MVEQMVSSNLSKYGLGKSPSITSSSDKQPVPLLQKEKALTQPFEAKNPPVPPTSNNVNRNLVYARRKSDAELSNSRTLDKNRTSQWVGDKKHTPHIEAKIEANDGVQSIATRVRNCENVVNSSAMEHWNARFLQLQKYLTQCDASNQEIYLQKLRSFSPDECSRHAVELERRAIQLLLEEGREIQRVKDLNVLGKSVGNHPLLQPLTPVFKSEKMV